MTLALRAHHLLCLLTYAGTGYSVEFVDNFNEVVGSIAAGEGVAPVVGPDAVCAPVCAAQGDCAHCHGSSVRMRDEWAAQELAPWLGPLAADGSWRLDRPVVARLRAAFAAGSIRSACAGCQWAPLCSDIAQRGYPGVLLHAVPT